MFTGLCIAYLNANLYFYISRLRKCYSIVDSIRYYDAIDLLKVVGRIAFV
jgi:hypothetical protein